ARSALIDGARRAAARPRTVSLTDPPERDDGGRAPIDTLADPHATPPDESLLRQEHGDAVEALVAGLPHEQREAFLLKREGLTFDQTADLPGPGRNTVKSRLRYALEKLRAGLASRGLLAGPGGDA